MKRQRSGSATYSGTGSGVGSALDAPGFTVLVALQPLADARGGSTQVEPAPAALRQAVTQLLSHHIHGSKLRWWRQAQGKGKGNRSDVSAGVVDPTVRLALEEAWEVVSARKAPSHRVAHVAVVSPHGLAVAVPSSVAPAGVTVLFKPLTGGVADIVDDVLVHRIAAEVAV